MLNADPGERPATNAHAHEPGPPSANVARARSEVPAEVDVAIVGCGLGGLTAGAYLAQSGLRVACFDSHYVAGGCATMFGRGSKANRYYFDVGLHYIGDCGPEGDIPKILRDLDIDIDFLPMDPDGFDELVFPDFQFRIPVSIELYRERLIELFPKEKRGIDRYVKFLQQVRWITQNPQARRGKINAKTAMSVLFKGRLLARYQTATIGEFIDSCTSDIRLKAVFLGQSGDYGLPPREVSAVLHAGLANHYFEGAFYPKGGGQVIADRIAQSIEAAGGSIHLRRGIARILVEDGRVAGVRTEERRGQTQTIRAKTVISNADIRRTMLDLVGAENLESAHVQKVENWKMAAALFMVFLGVKTDLRELGMRRSNYWVFDQYDMDDLYDATRAGGAPVAKAAYITSASLKDPDTPHHAPEGIQAVEIMSIVNGEAKHWGATDPDAIRWGYKRNETYKSIKARIEDELIARFDRLFPGAADSIVYRESATPLTQTRFTRAWAGTGYGLAATPDQFLRKRPGYRGPIEGLYLAGASTRSGHGIVGAMMSGQAAAHCVKKDLAAGE